MSNKRIERKYPGKSSAEIFEKVDEVMQRLSTKMSLHYEKDPAKKTGHVHKMGVKGSYLASDGAVAVDLHFPILVPRHVREQVEVDIGKKLDGLFA